MCGGYVERMAKHRRHDCLEGDHFLANSPQLYRAHVACGLCGSPPKVRQGGMERRDFGGLAGFWHYLWFGGSVKGNLDGGSVSCALWFKLFRGFIVVKPLESNAIRIGLNQFLRNTLFPA